MPERSEAQEIVEILKEAGYHRNDQFMCWVRHDVINGVSTTVYITDEELEMSGFDPWPEKKWD